MINWRTGNEVDRSFTIFEISKEKVEFFLKSKIED